MTRYRTIVADPPWEYDEGWPINRGARQGQRIGLPYPSLPIEMIAQLPVRTVALDDAHLFLWTTQRWLEAALEVVNDWGFRRSSVLTWCKPPVGIGPGGLFAVTSEFVIYARRGKPPHNERVASTWWEWPRAAHSQKPEAFLDLVERAVPGPYLEMFARRQRLGWDTWGNEALNHVEVA